jgi:hypothetical protein
VFPLCLCCFEYFILKSLFYSLVCNVCCIILSSFVSVSFVTMYVCTLFNLLFYVHMGGMSHSILWYFLYIAISNFILLRCIIRFRNLMELCFPFSNSESNINSLFIEFSSCFFYICFDCKLRECHLRFYNILLFNTSLRLDIVVYNPYTGCTLWLI